MLFHVHLSFRVQCKPSSGLEGQAQSPGRSMKINRPVAASSSYARPQYRSEAPNPCRKTTSGGPCPRTRARNPAEDFVMRPGAEGLRGFFHGGENGRTNHGPTTTRPLMDEWKLQTYSKVPGLSKVTWPDSPLFKRPVSKFPSLAVAVCGALSSLVHTTTVPRVTLIVVGWNWKLSMFTSRGRSPSQSSPAHRRPSFHPCRPSHPSCRPCHRP